MIIWIPDQYSNHHQNTRQRLCGIQTTIQTKTIQQSNTFSWSKWRTSLFFRSLLYMLLKPRGSMTPPCCWAKRKMETNFSCYILKWHFKCPEINCVTLKSGLFLSGFEPMTFAPSVKNDRWEDFWIWRLALATGSEDERSVAQALKERTLNNILG